MSSHANSPSSAPIQSMKMRNFLKLQRMAMEFRDKIDCLRAMCLCCAVCWYSCFPRPLSRASISLAYTIFPAYLAFLSKTKINEYFSFREIEADEISVRFRVFFGAIARVRSDSNRSSMRDCRWEIEIHLWSCADTKKGKAEVGREFLTTQQNSLALLPAFQPSVDGCDIFPT